MELDNLMKVFKCCIDDNCIECPLKSETRCLTTLPREAACMIEKLLAENKQLRVEKDVAIEDLKKALWDDENWLYPEEEETVVYEDDRDTD